ncbi:MAG: hypothetical protein LC637_12955 [Xanthomonadaceae bacterium]|nr:hypothetical protein [Xanthomonadaceae bacterium]
MLQHTKIAGLVATGLICVGLSGPAAAQSFPPSVKPTCTVPEATFQSWFAGDAVEPNGAVWPADSLNFPEHNTRCDFYRWGAQMFLWLTSPEGNGWVLDGPTIFTVSPPVNGERKLIRNGQGSAFEVTTRATKRDDIAELAQAGSGGVLLSQQKSLVYYGVHVNDVYGYFLSAQKTAGPGSYFGSVTDFPIGPNDINQLNMYMASAFPGEQLSDEMALTIELKTSWVDASTLSNPDDYVTVKADSPSFTRNADNTIWTRAGTEPLTLALVGMHVMGTVKNHPEFVWATFEHKDNTPDAGYFYTKPDGQTAYQPQPTSGSFTFHNGEFGTQANVECAQQASTDGDGYEAGDLIAARLKTPTDDPIKPLACSDGIIPSNTIREKPWGGKPDRNSEENNTLLISLNQSVLSQLAVGDVRKNYIQIGSIWTAPATTAGIAPIPSRPPFTTADLRGSLDLYNSTMETYTFEGAPNCFSCHALFKDDKGNYPTNSFGAFELSHIYSEIEPLHPTGN